MILSVDPRVADYVHHVDVEMTYCRSDTDPGQP